MMTEIYARASLTFVWVGEEDVMIDRRAISVLDRIENDWFKKQLAGKQSAEEAAKAGRIFSKQKFFMMSPFLARACPTKLFRFLTSLAAVGFAVLGLYKR